MPKSFEMTGKELRTIFMGTPDFAVESLKELVENGYNIVAVITSPDKPAGRGQKIRYSAVKEYALANNLKVLQPEKLKNPDFIDELHELKADLQIVVAFRMLPEVVWDMPPMGTFNLHASLLPQYRGAAPLNWAIINGEKESGVTTFLLKHEIDTGGVIFQEKVAIGPDDNVGVLHDKLMLIGSKLVVKTVDALASENVIPVGQDKLIPEEGGLKHAPKIFKDDCHINWSAPGAEIHNQIRGLSPYPAAWTKLLSLEARKETTMKIFKAHFEPAHHNYTPGTIITDKKSHLKVVCPDGFISLLTVQAAGKKRMEITDYLRGNQHIEQFRMN